MSWQDQSTVLYSVKLCCLKRKSVHSAKYSCTLLHCAWHTYSNCTMVKYVSVILSENVYFIFKRTEFTHTVDDARHMWLYMRKILLVLIRSHCQFGLKNPYYFITLKLGRGNWMCQQPDYYSRIYCMWSFTCSKFILRKQTFLRFFIIVPLFAKTLQMN